MSEISASAAIPSERVREHLSEHHRSAIDVLRIAACFGIVWFHTQAPGAVIGYAGLPALIALSVALSSPPNSGTSLSAIISKRSKRLLLPWGFWCAIYGARQFAAAVVQHSDLSEEFQWWMLLTGPSIHLWFLPYIFVATLMASWWRSLKLPELFALAAALAGLSAAFMLCSYWESVYSLTRPLAQWSFGLPAIFVGLALPNVRDQKPRFTGAVTAALTVLAVSLVCWLIDWRDLIIPYLVGTAAVALAWVSPWRLGPNIAWLGEMSYGVYLIHPLVISVVQRVLRIPIGPLFVMIVAIVSLVLVAVLRRGPLRYVM